MDESGMIYKLVELMGIEPTTCRSDRSPVSSCKLYGGAERDRTVDLLNAIQALSQLSYSPTLTTDF